MGVALISGISGFLGHHLAQTLLTQGYRVAGIPRNLFTDTNALSQYLSSYHPDYIFHLGAYGNHSTQNDVDQMIATNILNTYLLLRFSSPLSLKKFVYVGTSSEYGLKTKAMKETDLIEPQSPYAVTKACGSLLTRMFPQTLVVRPFSLFGEGESPSRFMPTLVSCLKNKKTMTLVPGVKHDWIYVLDGAEAIVKAAQSPLTGVLNIGSGRQYSNLEIVKMFESVSGKKLAYKEVGQLRSYDTNHWVANITKLKSMGFSSTYGLRCGIKRTYDYY